MRSLAEQLSIYESFHTNWFTKLTHYVGVPLLVFALLIFLGWVHIRVPNFFNMSSAWLLIISVAIYYFILDLTLGVVMAGILIVMNLIASLFSQPAPSLLGLEVFLACFILGLVLQFIGHLVERKQPAFTVSLVQLAIAPLYLVAEIFFYFGYKQDLRRKMDEYKVIKEQEGLI